MGAGIFITIEGGEGTGKSTLIRGLADAIEKTGKTCVVTREPGGTPLAERIRSLALDANQEQAFSPLAVALLMNAARDDHLVHKIRPALERGKWVICDRFADSTRAYQSTDGVAMPVLLELERAVVGDTRPNLTLVLDAAPAELRARRAARGTVDRFEQMDHTFHERIRQAFLDIAGKESERCVVLDALQSPDDLLGDAVAQLSDRFDLP